MRYRWLFLVLAGLLGFCACTRAAEVRIAEDGMLVADGKRIFVVGLYENPDDDGRLAEAVDAGFNLVRGSADVAALDRLHASGVYAWVNTGGRIDFTGDREKDEAGLRELVGAVGSHPALLVWEVPDEALWWKCWLKAYDRHKPLAEIVPEYQERAAKLAETFRAGYTFLRQIDPNHPVWMNHAPCNALEHLARMGEAADIVGCDIYPLLPNPTPGVDLSRGLLGMVGIMTAQMQRTAPGKPVWMVLQGHGWRDFDDLFGPRQENGQRPTFEESRFMAYDAIVRGARAILYWGTHTTPREAPLWGDLLRVVRELADRQALLSARDAALRPAVSARVLAFPVDGGVHVLGKEFEGGVWWLIVNEYPVLLSYTLDGLDALDGTAYGDTEAGVSATIKRGRLSLPIQGHGVHILRPDNARN